MKEGIPQSSPTERGFLRRSFDKVSLPFAFVGVPLGIYIGGTSLLAGEILKGAGAFLWAKLDYTQIKEHGKPPEKQSWYNPERILDRLTHTLGIGRNRLATNPA